MVRGAMAILLLAMVACGGGGGGDPPVLAVQNEPADGIAGEALASFFIRVDSGSASRVTVELESAGSLPPGRLAGLQGTLTVPVVNRLAHFDDVVLTGAAQGYRLRVRAGSASVATGPFDVGPAAAFRLAFLETPPDTPVGSPMDPFRVAVLDRWDNFVVGSTVDVTIDIDALDPFGRDVLLHASGTQVFEFVDCDGPYVLAPEPEQPPEQFDAMAFDEGGSERIWATTANGSLAWFDIFFGGGVQVVGSGGTLGRRYTGLYFDATGVLWGLPLNGSEERAIDTVTGRDDGGVVPITLAGETIEGFHGATVDPISGELYAAARLATGGPPRLLSIDNDNAARVRGTLQQGCASLATKLDGNGGRLFAVTPDPDPVLYEVSPLTAAMTAVIPLGNGGNGHAISYVFPAPAEIGGASLVQQPFDGIATFGDLQWTLMAGGVTLIATAPGLQPDVSNPFDISAPDTSATVSFTTAARTVDESDGTVTLSLTVSRAMPHDLTVVIDASALSGDTNLPGQVRSVIRAGETSAGIAFEITDDAAAEGDEVLAARITGVALGTVGPTATHRITIRDND
ncbi:MAG: hypothetical protein ACYS0E_00060 [Planctomycetota bacterium]